MIQTKLDKALISLKELSPVAIDMSLGRLRVLLEKLGNPQDKLPPVIHVAGTNGKGSTIAYLRSIMEAAGYKCHVYISPHLLVFNERIRLAGELIGDKALIEVLEEVKAVNAGDRITFFEITTAAAFLAFSRVQADVLLLETGMGGVNDATNVVSDPMLTVITTISYDHCDWLGRSLEEIAGQKAGIMKPGVPCVIGQQMAWAQDQVFPVFQKRANELMSPLIWNWGVICRDGKLRLGWNGQYYFYPLPNLHGDHQCWNAGTAIMALKNQTLFKISDEAIAAGVQNAEWPARLERVTKGAVAEMLPEGWELWYDGGHNDSGGEVLGRHLQTWTGSGPVHAVVGMLKSKDPILCVGPLLPQIESLTTFSFNNGPFDQGGASYDAEELSLILKARFENVQAYPSLKDSVRAVLSKEKPGKILVTGTLYAYKDIF